MRPKAILFDAGGTLVLQDPVALSRLLNHSVDPANAFDAHYRAMDAFARRRSAGEELSWVWWQDHFFAALGHPEPTTGAVLTNNGYGLWSMAIEGTLAAVDSLAMMGIKLAVVSNSDGSVRESLLEAGFGERFEFVIDSHDVGVAKPNPAIFGHALDRLGIAAEHTWYVGDSIYHDMAGALAAGLGLAVLVDPLDLAPEHPVRVKSVAELPELVGSGKWEV